MTFEGPSTKGAFLKDAVESGEGFFQVLTVANEVSNMVAWAKQRHPKLAKKAALYSPC